MSWTWSGTTKDIWGSVSLVDGLAYVVKTNLQLHCDKGRAMICLSFHRQPTRWVSRLYGLTL